MNLHCLLIEVQKTGHQIFIQPVTPSGMVKVFRDVIGLILYKAVFIFIRLVIVIKRFKPVVESVIKLIFIGIFLVIKYVIVTFIFKPYKGETRIILVFFIVFIVSVSDLLLQPLRNAAATSLSR